MSPIAEVRRPSTADIVLTPILTVLVPLVAIGSYFGTYAFNNAARCSCKISPEGTCNPDHGGASSALGPRQLAADRRSTAFVGVGGWLVA